MLNFTENPDHFVAEDFLAQGTNWTQSYRDFKYFLSLCPY